MDGVALASVVADMYTANYPDLVACETPFEYQSLGVSVAVVKGETSLLDAVNVVIKDVVDNELYVQWMKDAVTLSDSMNQ